MTIKAALLDERGVFLRLDEIESEAELTPRHLPQIVSCDLAPGAYVWIPDEKRGANGLLLNPYGGAFWDLAWLRRVTGTRAKGELLRARNGRTDPEEKAGAELGVLVDFVKKRGLAEGIIKLP